MNRVWVGGCVLVLAWGLVACQGAEPSGGGEGSERKAQEVVYGVDDRLDVYQVMDPVQSGLARGSVVALITAAVLDESDPDNIRLRSGTLQQSARLCSDQRFIDQPAAASCSGTLIAPDLVLTAGHCIDSGSCGSMRFVFDYWYAAAGTLETISAADVYRCAQVVVRDQTNTVDYAVVRLDRDVVGRTPVVLRPEDAALPVGTALTLIGFPSGIPAKVAAGGEVVSSGGAALEVFSATVDAFGGNSGSGVFDAGGEQVGILVRGQQDYTQRGNCFIVNTLPQSGAGGEGVVYVARALEALCEAEPMNALCESGMGGYCATCMTAAECQAGAQCALVPGSMGLRTCAPACSAASPCRQGHTCQGGACIPDQAPACVGEDVWSVDACGRQVVRLEDCPADRACRDGACQGALPGSTCAVAEEVESRSQTLTGTLSAEYGDDAGGSCAGAGPERVFTFTVTEPTPFTAQSRGFDTVLYLRSSCEDAASEIVCEDDTVPPGAAGTQISAELEPGTYFLFLDAWNDEVGAYTLTLTFGEFCVDACTAGARRCTGNQVETCRVDAQGCLSWQVTQTCPNGQSCQAGACVATAAGDTCQNATEIAALDGVFVGDLSSGYRADYAGTCGGAGADRVYTFFVAQPSLLTAELAGGSAPVLHLRSRCSELAFEEDCAVASFPQQTTALLEEQLAPGRYWLIVDVERDAGPYQLGVTLVPSCPRDCSAGEVRCVDGGFESCVIDATGCATFGDRVACDAGESCVDGACVPSCGAGCDDGDTRCSGAQVETCGPTADGCTAWGAPVACPAREACVEGECRPACVDACAAGARRCGGGGVQVCAPGPEGCLVWGPTMTCGANQQCVAGQCAPICTNQCTPGATRCTAQGLQVCARSPQGCGVWGAITSCAPGQTCQGDRCVDLCEDECVPGERLCASPRAVQICEEDAEGCARWNIQATCPGREVCVDGACSGVCMDACAAGATRCSAAGGVQTCALQPTGCLDWGRSVACAAAERCDAGRCVPACEAECQPGAQACFGEGFRRCQQRPNGCHVWSTTTPCAATERCLGGRCVPGCEAECEPGATVCEGTGALRVCVASADGCHRFADPTPCPDGFACEAGVCTEQCEAECTPPAQECFGAGVRVCLERPTGCHTWSRVRDCQPDERCERGICQPVCEAECAPGTLRCQGDVAQSCAADAEGCPRWVVTEVCGAEQLCDAGRCVLDCEAECEPGARRCLDDGVQRCEEDDLGCRRWSDLTLCAELEFCRDGFCEPGCADSCTPGAIICEGPGARVCEPSTEGCFDWSSLAFCDRDQVCADGACVAVCERACDPADALCISPTARVVCIEDAEGCTAWSSPLECPEGVSCADGRCAFPNTTRQEPTEPTDDPERARSFDAGRPAAGCLGCQTTPGRPWEPLVLLVGAVGVWVLRRRRG